MTLKQLLLPLVLLPVTGVRAQDYPTFEKHVAGLVRSGQYAEATHALEENSGWFKNDTSKTELFNWLAALYLHQKQWDKYIGLYNDHTFAEGEDSTLLSAARFYRLYDEKISTAATPGWVPYSTSRFSGTPRVKVRINGKKYRFWVDTGAGLSVVTDRVAEKCGLRQYKPGAGSATSATGTQVGIWYAVIDSIQGAGLSVKNHPCLVLKQSDLKFRFLGITLVKIHGLIGWNLLQELAVDMDFKNKKIRFDLPKEKTAASGNNFFWMDQPLVSVRSEKNEALDFFIDTGASESGLYQAIYGKIDTSQAKSKTLTLGSAGGTRTIRTMVIPETKITVDGQTLTLVDAAVQPMPYNKGAFVRYGVLGIRELKNYLLHFSMTEGIFRLTPL